jgi:hypothetical protein
MSSLSGERIGTLRSALSRRRTALVVALAAYGLNALLAGCRRDCTELGCFERGLIVELAPTLAARGETHVRVDFEGGSFSCPTNEPVCSIDDHFPARVTLSWLRRDHVVRTAQRPVAYSETYPNGEHCPGRCRVGRVALD